MENKDIPISHELSAAFRAAGIAISRMAETIKNYAEVVISMAKTMHDFVESHYPNKHVKHLVKYGYGRTKKKNIHRASKYIQKQAKLELRRKKKK